MSTETAFAYDTLPYPIRSDIPKANRAIWDHVAHPGCWWTGEERVAIAAEVRRARHCGLCKSRKESLAPYSIDGEHDHGGSLPATVVEAVHRVTTDSGRLKRSWFNGLLENSLTDAPPSDAPLSDAQYVEIVSIIAVMLTVDEFHHALGLPLEPLPAPQAGEPKRYRPPGARPGGAWVPMIPAEGAVGAEADIYGGGNRIVNVVSALSLIPDAIRMANVILSAYYVPGPEMPDLSRNAGRALRRPQMEFIAARVSSINDCFY